MKFLVIRFSSIGDIVLATPAIRCLKQQVPGAELHFLSKSSFRAVTEANPYIDRFFYFKNDLAALIRELKKEQYDYIIDLQDNFRSRRIGWALSSRKLIYPKERWEKFLLTKFHINRMSGRHISERSVDTLSPLGVVNDGKGMDYFIPTEQEVAVTAIPLTHRNGYIAVVIAASYYTKKLPVEKLQELCKLIPYPLMLIGGKEEKAEGDRIAAAYPEKIFNACGAFSLHASADLVRKSKLVISHDTGLLYIACAFNKPVLAIWGGTSPLLDVEPYYAASEKNRYQNFIVPNLKCQPCSNYGTRTCPRKHFACMQHQDIRAIAAAAMQRMEA